MKRQLFLLIVFLPILLIGCSDDGPTTPAPGPVNTSATPGELMDLFVHAYETMDADEYDVALHDDFRFFFLFVQDGFWNKAEDLISIGNMFSGEARTNNEGDLTRAITSIDVFQMIPSTPWTDVSASHPYFGSVEGCMTARYQVQLVISHSHGTIMLDSEQAFYALPVAEEVDGTTQDVWYLLGHGGRVKSNESLSWGDLKVSYR